MSKIGKLITFVSAIITAVWCCIQIIDKVYNQRPVLGYFAKCMDIRDKQDGIRFENHEHPSLSDKLVESKKCMDTISGMDNLQFCEVAIKNTGNLDMSYDNLYPNAPLRVCFESYIPGNSFAYLDMTENEKYMGALIDKVEKDCAYIKFNAWEPKSTIKIKLLTDTNIKKIQVLARSKFFNRVDPLDYETAVLAGDWAQASKLNPISRFWDYIIYFLLFLGCLGSLALCFEKKLKSLYARYIKGVSNKEQKL